VEDVEEALRGVGQAGLDHPPPLVAEVLPLIDDDGIQLPLAARQLIERAVECVLGRLVVVRPLAVAEQCGGSPASSAVQRAKSRTSTPLPAVSCWTCSASSGL